MEEIHQIGSLRTELDLLLRGNPRRAIAHRMQVTPRAKSRFGRTTPPLSPAFLDPTGKISTKYRGDAAFRMHETQANFFPGQTLPFAFVFGIRRNFHHRDHRTIHLADKGDSGHRPGHNLPLGLLLANDWRVMFGDPLNRAYRHLDPIVFLQLFRHPPKSRICPKITHHPLQRLRTAPATDPRTGAETPLDPCAIPPQRFYHIDFTEGRVPIEFFYPPNVTQAPLVPLPHSSPLHVPPRRPELRCPSGGVLRSLDVPLHPPSPSLRQRLPPRPASFPYGHAT
ncbi:MAG: hypothetical protein AW06_004361 [Candidatus Accumulibacter cognatus]|uniref:Uncharacterized protein n=1 Tax=Candidatus Accumulibacter cognatus TaxID=2954383 RepID=A0A080MC24_9PROT|nr:MAG: hypothetical protein AW06_004361 [Candidatus Accumulibacter cognatus]